MIELPEAKTLSQQISKTLKGKKITHVVAAHTPHKFAWYYKDPGNYNSRLKGKTIHKTDFHGSFVEVFADDMLILYSEGVRLRLLAAKVASPPKHQLVIEFTDNTKLVASIQMYGGLMCLKPEEADIDYYLNAKEKKSPFTKAFNEQYFDNIISDDSIQKLSVKALLATEQHIPGLGNGVLQDILFNAKVHPKKRVNTLTDEQEEAIYHSIKDTLVEMANGNGRDTETDIFGNSGGYKTKMSKNTVNTPCSVCGDSIEKASYLGGSVYFCKGCQAV